MDLVLEVHGLVLASERLRENRSQGCDQMSLCGGVLLLELSVGENTSSHVGTTKREPPPSATDSDNLLLRSRVWFGCAAARLSNNLVPVYNC